MKMTYSWPQNSDLPSPQKDLFLELLKRAVEICKLDLEKNNIVSISFVDAVDIAAINIEHVGHEGVTDVISFDYRSNSDSNDDYASVGNETAIELIICIDKAFAEGKARSDSSYAGELVLYIVHGLLHVAGEDDLEPEMRKRMRKREKEVIGELESEFLFSDIFASIIGNSQ